MFRRMIFLDFRYDTFDISVDTRTKVLEFNLNCDIFAQPGTRIRLLAEANEETEKVNEHPGQFFGAFLDA